MNTPREIPVASIDPNPYQPRKRMDEGELKELADSIKQQGLQQPPQARVVNDVKGNMRWQLVFGHRRFAAWQIACPGKPFPVVEVVKDDRQMAEGAATENGQRADLNPIERAAGIDDLIQKFGLTQLDAGAFYNLKTQGAVSNVLRLLKLTPHIQQKLIDGVLPERLARALIFISGIDPNKANEFVDDAILEATDEDDELIAADLENNVIAKVTHWAHQNGAEIAPEMWPLNWEPIGVSFTNGKKGDGYHSVTACNGCEFFLKGNNKMCLRPACHSAKLGAWAQKESQRVTRELGLEDGNGYTDDAVLWVGDYEKREQVQKLLKDKPKHLIIIPYTGNKSVAWQRKAVLGSPYVALGTTDEKFLKAWHAKDKPKEKRKPISQEDHKKRWEAEQAERTARRAHALAVVKRVSPALITKLPNDEMLKLIYRAIDPAKADKFAKMSINQRRAEFASNLLIEVLEIHWDADPETIASLPNILKPLKVKLPPNWDAAPDPEPESKPVATPKKGKKKQP